MGKTLISWATHTWNPVTGCSKPIETDAVTGKRFISPECEHCYAESLSLRRGWTQHHWTEPNAELNVKLRPERLRMPRTLKHPAGADITKPSTTLRVFTNSMSDMFHRLVPDSYIAECFKVMNDTPDIIYQILTKRPERVADWPGLWTPNIWMGTSCGHEKTIHRVDHLRRSGAQVKFISAEPLLTPLDDLDITGIHQVIVGGESGGGYRPMNHAWARTLKNKCVAGGVAFFMKQDAAFRTETRCYLVEEDGSCWKWQQFPGEMTPPERVEPDNAKKHKELFPILVGAR